MAQYPEPALYPPNESRIKAFAKWILNFILLVIALIFAILIIKAWESSSYIAHIWRECMPEVQMGFMIALLFAGLFFFSILARLIVWKN